MNSGSQGLSFHQDMALMQMCAGKEEIFSLPMWKEKLTSVKNTPCKGENRQAKRKLYSSGSASEDEDKKTPTLKKRRNSPGGDSSPTTGLQTKPRTPVSTQRHSTVPLSERQQMALLMRQITDESHHGNDTLPNYGAPGSPFSIASKRAQNNDCKSYKRNSRGETPLHTAAIKGDIKTVKKLIETGIDVNIKDYAGWTALHEACNYGRIDVAKCLLKAGANVNVQGLDNDLPLHDAARNGHIKIVELLLRHGANPLLQNLKGKSSLDVAKGDEIFKLMSGETIITVDSSSCFSLSDPRSPASSGSCPIDQDEERILSQKEAQFNSDNKFQLSNAHESHWDQEVQNVKSSPLEDHSFVTTTCSSQHMHQLAMPRTVPSTIIYNQDQVLWNQNLNSKKSFNLVGCPDRSCLPQDQSFFSSVDNAVKIQDSLAVFKDINDKLSGNMVMSWKNTTTLGITTNENDRDVNDDFSKTLSSVEQSTSNFNSISNSENVELDSITAQSSDNSKPFVAQFEDISDPEDDEAKAGEDSIVKMKNNFLMNSLPNMLPPNISSNLYKQSAPLYFNASISNCSMSQFSLMQNFHWSNLGYGCFPVITSTSTTSELPQANVALTQNSHCNPGLPVSVWRCLSPNKPLNPPSPNTSISALKAVIQSLKEGNTTQAESNLNHPIESPRPRCDQEGCNLLLSKFFMPNIKDSKIPDHDEGVINASDLNCQSYTKIPNNTLKVEPFEENMCSQSLVADCKALQDVLHNESTFSPCVSSVTQVEISKHLSEDSINISLHLTRSIDVTLNTCNKLASDLHMSVACPSPTLKSVYLNVAPIIEQSDLSKVLNLSESVVSRASSPTESLDGIVNFPKVPPIKIVLPSKIFEAASEKYIPISKANMPYVVNAPVTEDVSVECSTCTTQSLSVIPSRQCVDNVSTFSSIVLTKAESHSIHPELDVAPAKKRRKQGCRTPGKDNELDTDSFQRTNKDSSVASTPLLQNSEDTSAKVTDDLMPSSLKNTAERRVTRSTTASKQQRPGSQKDHKFQIDTDIINGSGRSDVSNPIILQRQDNDHNSSSKEEDEIVFGHSVGRKSKIKGQKVVNDISSTCDFYVPVPPPHVFKKPINPYEAYLNFKKKVADRRNKLSTTYPKPPPKFSEYLITKGTYRLDPNADAGLREPLSMLPVPATIPDPMKTLFNEQERLRSDLRHHHHKERDRLILSAEQETLRIHGKAARASANEGLALSACAILCSESPCYPLESEQDVIKDSRSRYTGRHFHGWLQEISEKYSRLKMELLARHRHEATILHGMQKLCWEWKMKELGLCDCYSMPLIDPSHVPVVVVDDGLVLSIT